MQTETVATTSATEQMNRTPVVALVGATTISEIGSVLTLIALPWFVLVTTGSAAKTGLTGFFIALPSFVAGLFGGTVVDRLGHKRASVIADVVSGVGIVLVPLLYHTVGLAFWQLLALVFLGALLTIPGVSARRSLLPELAGLARWRLARVNTAFEAIQFLSLLLGPPLAGLLIVWLGASNVLWIDAATFGVSAAIVALAIPAAPTGAPAAPGGYLAELARGLRFLRRDPVLLSLALSLAITNFLGNSAFAVLLPVYAKETYGRATVLGLLAAVWGAGALAWAAAFGAIGHPLSRRVLWIAPPLVAGLVYAVFALKPPLPLLAVALALDGLAIGPGNPLLVTIRHERTPAELRGRVFGTFSAIAQVATPLGIVLAGYLVEGLGLRITLLALSVSFLVVGAGMLFVPAFHDMDAPAQAGLHEGAA
jgi:MFS family permease